MDLHYSQTNQRYIRTSLKFYYLMDLHYSQTSSAGSVVVPGVLLPYGFTLFSNLAGNAIWNASVLLPYGFTLFSNQPEPLIDLIAVLLPYGFTLFSNC